VPKPGAGDINAYGIRDRDYPIAKEEGTYRIVVIGDSIGFGYCKPQEVLPMEATFVKLIEKQLVTSPPPGYSKLEVINLSVSGYNSVQEVEFFREKGLALEPDLVLVAYCLNDSQDNSRELNTLEEHDQWDSYREWTGLVQSEAIMRSHLVRLVWHRFPLLRGADAKDPEGEKKKEKVDYSKVGFEWLGELAAEHGFRTLVVVFPYFEPFDDYPLHAKEGHARAQKYASENGFEVLDLLPAFREASDGDATALRGRCWSVHPDEKGHAVAAEEIADYLLDGFSAAR
jgi:lysophospholipase L1-like esterase